MYPPSSSPLSSQKPMGPTGLTRYGSAPSSLLGTAVDSLIGPNREFSALPSSSSLMAHHQYFSGDSSSVTSESSCRANSSNGPKEQEQSKGLQRSYGLNEMAVGDFLTASNIKSGGGGSGGGSPASASSALVRQRSSPAGLLNHLASVADNGFSVTRGSGGYTSQGVSDSGHGVSRLKPQLSFTRQDSLSQISEVSEDVVDGISSDNGHQNAMHSYATNSFGMDSWDNTNSIIFSAPPGERAKNADNDIFNCLHALETQFSMPQTTLEMATVEKLMHIPEDSVPCKIRAKRGCATHPRSIAERGRYHGEEEALWRGVIDCKYGSDWGGWCTMESRDSYGVSLWKFIRKGWGRFLKQVNFSVGDGSKIRFWSDVWCGDIELFRAFPAVFRLATNKQASVSDVMVSSNGVVLWDEGFSRSVQDWEVEEVTEFFRQLYSVVLRRQGRDQLCWNQTASKKFSVRSYYKVILNQHHIDFPWKRIWKAHVPSKVAFFVWTAAIGNIQTIDNLRKRGMIVVDWCFMCKKEAKSANHLLLHCEMAKVLWDGVFGKVGLCWVMPEAVVDFLTCWTNFQMHTCPQVAAAWKMLPLCIMWCIWWERNERCFNDRERNRDAFWKFFISTLISWFSAIVLKGGDVNAFLSSFF